VVKHLTEAKFVDALKPFVLVAEDFKNSLGFA
jgi:hypothetical protein